MRKDHDFIPNGRHVSRDEFYQYSKRRDEEYKRINNRLELVEKAEEKTYQLISSIERMAASIENIIKIQEKQEKQIEIHDGRLDNLETKSGKKWEDISQHMWKAVAAAIVAYVLYQAGIFQIP